MASAPKADAGSSGKSPVSGSGKSLPEVVANPEVEVVANPVFATTEDDADFDADFEQDDDIEALRGWRIERNSNGQYRYRWQVKDENGEPDKYITSSGKTGYRRGSKYITKAKAHQELENGK